MRITDKIMNVINTAKISVALLIMLTVYVTAPVFVVTGEALTTPTCEAGSHQVAGQCTPDPAPDAAPIASTLDYATESVLIVEGQNPDTTPVVEVTFPNGAQIWIPEEDPSGGHVTRVWLDNSPLYSGGWLLQVNGETGVTRWIDVHERLTLNDDEQDAPEAVQTTVQTVAHVSALPAQPHRFTAAERKAARLILARLRTRVLPVEEDWTWQGMPRVVGAHNDALSRAAQAAGLHGKNWPWSSKARTWLSQVVRTGKG